MFSDATLRDMANRKPSTRDATFAISGVGKVKWKRYGSQFLDAVRDAPN